MIIYLLKNREFNTFEVRYSESIDINEEENIPHLIKHFWHVIKVQVENSEVINAVEMLPDGRFMNIPFDGTD